MRGVFGPPPAAPLAAHRGLIRELTTVSPRHRTFRARGDACGDSVVSHAYQGALWCPDRPNTGHVHASWPNASGIAAKTCRLTRPARRV